MMTTKNEALSYVKNQIDTLDIFKVVYDDISDIKKIAEEFNKFDDVIVFGTGGSSLGAKSLVNFHSQNNNIRNKVHFIENTDSRSFLNKISKCNKNKTGIIVISKSGRTTETIMLFLTLCEIWKDFDYEHNAIAITENSENNDLKNIALQKKMRVIEHPKKIGGRFSVFSIVGLLPSSIQGISIESFLNGAKKVIDEIKSINNPEDSKIFMDIINEYESYKNGSINQHVLLTYSDFLNDLGKWFVQLTGESLGKSENFGITPITTTGTVDQHSMLQLFLGGPSNKFFTILMQEQNDITPNININLKSNVLDSINNHNILDLMNSHQKTTIEVLMKKAPVRIISFKEFNEENIGYFMMLSFIEIITIAHLANINPFDQLAVEESKKLVLNYVKQI